MIKHRKSWRDLEIGEKILWNPKDNPNVKEIATITDITKENAIARYENVNLWIDDDTISDFTLDV